jgi:heavy metal sensor kinase
MTAPSTSGGRIRRLLRGLRMRLTLSFVGFFGVLMAATGLLFHHGLETTMRDQAEDLLTQEWLTVREHLRVEGGHPRWVYDPNDPEEAYAVERIRRVLLLTDIDGRILECSSSFQALGTEESASLREAAAAAPVLRVKRNARGDTYYIRMGRIRLQGENYLLALGLPFAAPNRALGRFIRAYFLLLPLLLLGIVVIGWFLAGRAMRPLNEIAATAGRVSAENLSLRIRPPGTGDELEQMVRTFNIMMDRLQRNFEQMRQFSIDASHELRTPITAVRGQLEVALLNARTVEQYRDAVATAMQDVEKMSQIVKSLLLLAQAESGQLVLQRSPHDLASLVSEVVAQFQVSADEKNTKLTASLPERCVASLDRIQFERLVSNLVSNAVKYTQPGGMVDVKLSQSQGQVELAVSDNGPGIPAAHLPYIFERFYRVRDGDRESDKGVGLGLSFVSWIVQAHGGRIKVSSKPGEGSTFTVTLPAGVPDGELPQTSVKNPAA